MTRNYVLALILISGNLLTFDSTATEAFSMVAERATRSYQDMLDVRLIRVLVVRNKTNYFFDGAQQRGITYDFLKSFEDQFNESLGTGHLKVYVGFIPVPREQLIPALLDGRGDTYSNH
jgi:membrane-bound lytic murein transglycosylase MltF